MFEDERRDHQIVHPIVLAVFIVLLAIDVVLYLFLILNIIGLLVGIIISILIAAAIRIANQWEKGVILRMGKFIGLRGPGIFLIIPIIDRVYRYIDQRVRVTDFKAEETLTKDTVPVNVDAVVYWMVWDAEKAALEVREYIRAVYYIAQTSLRDIIGKHDLADLLQNREKIAEALQVTLDEHTNPWGITCQTVGIKDIVIPSALADAMSKQAQAERERQARIILGTAETEISEKFAKASENYLENPVALQLRGMNMLFEGLKEKGSLVIVPSSALESMNLGAIGGLTALAKTEEGKGKGDK
ncbi:MAG: slipin family protein [Candidatus Aminicenantes bacterium]|nr:slipin family protein [Candidatus Aminicenantes bacterium]NIM79009.1 slipin family protein [Candidatus Aminicenantes bacterium]NIN18267.1 slipin family protein [Candidatus Aminicenantes bacterium]NIN42164.1 slipin family protein [Candidatus Aminicenantes bacterium]NIN84920.1 slipin family protein [Candidatus Aminicenantes bacterium]